MPNRVLKDVILTSEGLDQVSAEAERLFYRLLVVADDYGRFSADQRVILARCFPLKVDALRSSTVAEWYRELEQASVIGTYRIDGKLYGQFLEWLQRKRNSQQKFPPPDDPGASVVAPQGEFPQQSAAICGEPPPPAATCGESPPPAARACVRPQSQSEEKKRFRIKAAPILSTNVDNPDAPGPWLSPEEARNLHGMVTELRAKYPAFWPKLDHMIRSWMRHRPPWEVCRGAMQQLLEHEARNPIRYAAKILRVEEPNYHEARAIAEAQKLKEPASAGPRISIDQPAATQIGPTVAAVLSRMHSKQGPSNSPRPEAADVTPAVAATERSPP